MPGWVALLLYMGGGLAIPAVGIAHYLLTARSTRRYYAAFAAEHGWDYYSRSDVPSWIRALPMPPDAGRLATGDITCQHCFVGDRHGHRVLLAELRYEKDSDYSDYVCTVVGILDPPPGLPTLVANSGVHPDIDLAAVIELVQTWHGVRMWGTGDVVWTLTTGPLSSTGMIDLRVNQLRTLLAAAGS